MGVHEDLFAPVVEEASFLVEHAIRMLSPREDVDVVVGVRGDCADLAPLPPLRHFAPALDELVLAVAYFNFHVISSLDGESNEGQPIIRVNRLA